MTEAPIFTVARIAAQADGSFAYSRSGSLALTLAVEDRHGNMVDVVAWRDPSHWWLRRDDLTPILGAESLAMASWHHEHILLWETPEAWVQSHRPGGEADRHHCVCILRWDVDLRPLFGGVPRIDCAVPELRGQLRKALRRFEPQITAPPPEVRRAA